MLRRLAAPLAIVGVAAVSPQAALPGWRFVRPEATEFTLFSAPVLGGELPTILHPRDSLWVLRCPGAWCTVRAEPSRGDTIYAHGEDLITRAELVAYYARQGWSASQLNAVMRGQVKLGMTEEMVAAAWGPPGLITEIATTAGTTVTRHYGSCAWLQFRSHRVVAVHDCR